VDIYQLPEPTTATLCFLLGESEAMFLRAREVWQAAGNGARVLLDKLEMTRRGLGGKWTMRFRNIHGAPDTLMSSTERSVDAVVDLTMTDCDCK